MKLLFSKAERIRYLGFNDVCLVMVGILPLSVLSNILFGGGGWHLTFDQRLLCLAVSTTYTLTYGVASRYVVLQFRRKFPQEEQTFKRILFVLPVLFLVVVTITLLSVPIIDKLRLYRFLPDQPLAFKILLAYTLVILVMSIYEGVFFFTKFRQSTIERERLAKENMKSQLSVLKQQMNPHFLFNSLNTLVNIIPEDSRKATLFTQRLSAVYRRILEWRHKELIPLREEVVALQDYIFLMQTRFEDKLRVRWQLPDETAARTWSAAESRTQSGQEQRQTMKQGFILPPMLGNHYVVPLSLQLLVENAIKHNVVSSDQPLTITIEVDESSITVRNALNFRSGRNLESTGWGHHNLKSRYAMVTEDKIDIRQTEREYSVRIPLIVSRLAVRAATA